MTLSPINEADSPIIELVETGELILCFERYLGSKKMPNPV